MLISLGVRFKLDNFSSSLGGFFGGFNPPTSASTRDTQGFPVELPDPFVPHTPMSQTTRHAVEVLTANHTLGRDCPVPTNHRPAVVSLQQVALEPDPVLLSALGRRGISTHASVIHLR